MSRPIRLLDPQVALRDSGRPVLTQAQATTLTQQILSMTSADTVMVRVTHTANVVTRIANDQVRSTNDGDALTIAIFTKYGAGAQVAISTNQFGESTLRAVVERCEALAREQIRHEPLLQQPQRQDTYIPVQLWHEPTIRAMAAARETVAPALIERVTQRSLRTAGFVGLMARARAILTKEGIFAYGEETDSEITVTARSTDGTSSGWAGQAARDWSTIDYAAVATQAAELALQGQGAVAIEPGRRTAILGPAAVVQMLRYFAQELNAFDTDQGRTGFSKTGGGNKIGQEMFDRRVHMSSDPADPEGGYCNFFSEGLANPKMTWIEQGVLKNLAYPLGHAMAKGKTYAEDPYSLRMAGGPSSIQAMIAACEEGIYVNRLSAVDLLNLRTGMMTGVTRDGCFLIKRGKIDRAVKNFRFMDSPFFFLNRLLALGPTARTTFGYTPPGASERSFERDSPFSWPRRPMIVPPIMVQDFNFAALADAI